MASISLKSSSSDSPSPRSSTKILSSRILETMDPCVVFMKELMSQYASKWEMQGGIYSLAQGVVYWEPPSTCSDALVQAIQDDDSTKSSSLLHTYGPAAGIPELVAALQTKIQVENNLSQHHVMVTVGANQAYMNCVLTLMDDKSQAVVFAPYYFNHQMAIQMTCGTDSVLVGPSDEDGIPDIEWLRQTLQQDKDNKDDTKKINMVTLVNPGNPTGVFLTREEVLQPIVDLCREFGVWLILDATYEYFMTTPHNTVLPTFPDDPHVIHIFSFSKSYALAGYRCGYLVLHKNKNNLKVWDNLLKVQDTIPIGPPRISQVAALGALQAGPEWVREQYATLEPSRKVILNAMAGLDQTMGGSGAMYVMGKFPSCHEKKDDDDSIIAADDVEICRVLVEQYGVAVIPGSYCGYPGWIRVCYANLEPRMCALAAERLQQGLTNILREMGSS